LEGVVGLVHDGAALREQSTGEAHPGRKQRS
jgi:hypothetical protein